MKISLEWLKKYVSFKLSPKDLADVLTMAGAEVEKTLNVDGDTVFELEVTPNRADCLSHVGIARELSAVLNTSLKSPQSSKLLFPKKKCPIKIEDPGACLRYVGAVVEGVSVLSSEKDMSKLLSSVGIRTVNNIVDITNFGLMESGQPLHAFDHDKLIGGTVIVRRARKGEKIVTLDGLTRELDPSILIIADDARPVAIAGIMGGKETEITANTKNILLESAYFDPITIRRAARKLGLRSDSSYRFERGTDIEAVALGSGRALSLILQSAGGKIAQYADVCVKRASGKKNNILVTAKDIERYLGRSFSAKEIKNILNKLGFVTKEKKGSFVVASPSFRPDVKQGVDLIEEIARVAGYDKLPMCLPEIKASTIPVNHNRVLRQTISDLLVGQGFFEIVTYSMTNNAALTRSNLENGLGIKIQNPLSLDQECLRPSLLPAFLSVSASNINRGNKDLKLFETGKIYHSSQESEALGLLLTGFERNDWRRGKIEEISLFDLKGKTEEIFGRLNIACFDFQPLDRPYFEPGQAVNIILDGKGVGEFGKISSSVLQNWEIKQKSVYFAQIQLGDLYKNSFIKKPFIAISEYPEITRDVSIAVDRNISFQAIKELTKKHGAQVLAEVRFKEEYLGEKIPQGSRGLIFSLIYQSKERTLREDEVSVVHESILAALKEKFFAVIR